MDKWYLLRPLPQDIIFIMWVVGENSAGAQLDASEQLHAAGKYGVLRGLCAADKQRRVGEVERCLRWLLVQSPAYNTNQHVPGQVPIPEMSMHDGLFCPQCVKVNLKGRLFKMTKKEVCKSLESQQCSAASGLLPVFEFILHTFASMFTTAIRKTVKAIKEFFLSDSQTSRTAANCTKTKHETNLNPPEMVKDVKLL